MRKILFAFVTGCIVMSFLHTHGKFILQEYLLYYLWFVPPVLLLELVRCRFRNGGTSLSEEDIKGVVLFFFLLLALSSSLLRHKWFFFLNWQDAHTPGFGCFMAGITRFLFLTQFLLPIFLLSRKRLPFFAAGFFIVFQVLCLFVFLLNTKGHILYEDDHTSFMYRLWEFKHTFPSLINYSPYWNAGDVSPSGTATGAVMPGILFWPILRIFSVAHIYTYIIAFLFIIAVPLLYVFSLRIIGGDWISAWCAGIFSLGVSQYYFLWLFHYGTVPAVLSSALMVPFSAAVFRAVYMNKTEFWIGTVIILTAFFLILWPPGVIMAVCGVVPAFFAFRRLFPKKIGFFGVCLICVFVLYLKMLMVIIRPDIIGIVSSAHGSLWKKITAVLTWGALKDGWQYLGAEIREGNPLIIIFGLGGIFLLPERRIRIWFMPLIIITAMLSAYIKDVVPALELRRMAVPMFFAAVVPASLWMSRLLKGRGIRYSIIPAALSALIVLGGWNCVMLYNNKGLARYKTIPPDISRIAEWIKQNSLRGGRVLFTGLTMHGYGHAHVAFMPYLAGREMLAADYFHYSPRIMPPGLPPEEYAESREGLFRYMKLYNITCIIVQDDKWKDVFRRYSEDYTEAITAGGKTIFKVTGLKNSLFIKGSGSVCAGFNIFKIKLNSPEEGAVIKYNWTEGLSASPPAVIYPFTAGDGIKFIAIRPNGTEDITIHYKAKPYSFFTSQ